MYIFAFVFSAELGDFDPEVHTPGYISEFHFVPKQTEALELATYEEFQKCRCVPIYLLHIFSGEASLSLLFLPPLSVGGTIFIQL